MGKLADYLQEHLMGEVLDGAEVRRHFATDASVLYLEPAVIVYPRNEQDVRKVARFAWRLAEKGRVIPITARGGGSDLTGASIGSGIVLVFPAHMNRVVDMKSKKNEVIFQVEPGANVAKLQEALNVQYRMLPPAPQSAEYATIGGSVANNSYGLYSQKYGSMRNYVNGLRVVLANGEVIRTQRLSKRELSRKLGLANFEGQVYRQVDTLLSDNEELVNNLPAGVAYPLNLVRQKNDSFDLTPLFVGGQGTLGIISEVEIKSEHYNPQPTAMLAYVDSLSLLTELVQQLQTSEPAAMEMLDKHVIKQVTRLAPRALKTSLVKQSDFVLILEFDDSVQRTLGRKLKKAKKILDKAGVEYSVAEDDASRERIWKVRSSIAHVLSDSSSKGKPVPAIESASVPLERYAELYQGAAQLFEDLRVPFMAWGHIGQGQLSMMPKFDLSEIGGRQKLIKLMDAYHRLVLQLGGCTSIGAAGRLRGMYQPYEAGDDAYMLMVQLKGIFDPLGILNPGVKTDVGRQEVIAALRSSYTLTQYYAHLPRI